eukprot:8440858-Ditylum_brightwellii.AAC.2
MKWCRLPCGSHPIIPTDKIGDRIQEAIEEQNDIGWDNFLEGHILYKWSHAQHLYCNAFLSKKEFDSNTWTSKLILAIWSIFVNI